MKLEDDLEILAYDIAFWLAGIVNPDYPLAKLGDLCVEVSGKLRATAIIVLLTKADSDGFFHNLIRSANCRLVYLQRLAAAGISDDHHQASGRIQPFLDAAAAADFKTARMIAALSPLEWLAGHEYEDDFCHAQILHELITYPRRETRLQYLFERYEKVLAGQADAKLELAKVLAAGDKPAFEPAFANLLAQRAAAIDAEIARHKMEDALVIAERYVYIEGLAMLQIAKSLGFDTQAEYRFCPSIARVAMQTPFPGE